MLAPARLHQLAKADRDQKLVRPVGRILGVGNDKLEGAEHINLVAKKVTLNGLIPTVASVRPKAVQWKKGSYDDADFILGIWTFKKQTDPETVPAATLAQFAVKYLASPAASGELKEMSGGGTGGDEETEEDGSNGEDGT